MDFQPEYFPYPLLVLERTDSTNRYLDEWCGDKSVQVKELTTVVADYQTAGKGQRGNSWEAAAGQNLLFSFVLYPVFIEAQHQFVLSQIAALSVKEALDGLVADVSIKWPNDIYWREKKIGGILIEHNVDGSHLSRSIVGVGLNVNQEAFHSDAPNPVSLKQITGRGYARQDLLADILSRVHAYYARLRAEVSGAFCPYLSARYEEALFRRVGWHLYADASGTFRARIVRVGQDGRLVLEDKEGHLRSYLFKEVRYVL